jgi:hypothetical protein
MEKSNLIFRSFINSFFTALYITGVALFTFGAQKIFGTIEDNFRMPLAMLLLFVLSASVVSTLILGKPILLYLENKKVEGIKMFLYSIGWLFVFAILAFASILL